MLSDSGFLGNVSFEISWKVIVTKRLVLLCLSPVDTFQWRSPISPSYNPFIQHPYFIRFQEIE